MTSPHLWLHGDPTDGRSIDPPQPTEPTAEHPADAAAPTGPAGPGRGGPPSGRRRSRFVPALAGGAVSATLMTAGLFGLGVLDTSPDTSTATSTPPAAAQSGLGARQRGDVGAIYAAASPGVVSIKNQGGSGTGFVVDRDGTIVTNAHVVGDASQVQVQFDADGQTVTGEVKGVDRSSDLAVVRVDPSGVRDLRPLTLADSGDVKVGDLTVAIGSPFGLPQTATSGIVSGLEREIRAPDGFAIDKVIQTDAPINPGNSGGPLLDGRGRVIGVNSQIQTGGSGGNVGIGFAVPSNTLQEILPRLKAGQAIERAFLGVSSAQGANGADVQEVTAGSPAEQAGLRKGDVIVAVDSKTVKGPEEITEVMGEHRPGDRIELEVQRGGDRQTLEVELGKRPTQTP